MKVERAPTLPVEAEEIPPRTLGKAGRLDNLMSQPQATQLRANALHALTVTIPRWILAGDFNEILSKGQDLALVRIERLRQNEAMFHQRGSTSWTNNRNSPSRKSASYRAKGVRYLRSVPSLLAYVAGSSTPRLEGEAFELSASLLVGLCQRAQDFLVWIPVFPARHAQTGLGDQVGIDLCSVVAKESE
jgi:hypothetical protein